jgi:hypothetical protein
MGAPSDAVVTEQKAADAAATPATLDGQQLVVRNASMSIRVADIDKGVTGVRSAAKSTNAEIVDLSVDRGGDIPKPEMAGVTAGPASASITLRVSADKLDALRDALGKVGDVTAQSESSSDVTEQAIDMDARLKNLRAQEAQLREFFNRATKVSELLSIEQELSRVRGEIESMDAQLTYLKRQAARATLSVSLTEPAPVVSPNGADWGFRDALTSGVRGAAMLITALITAIIALLPVEIVAAVLFVVLRNRRRKRIASRAGEGAASAPEPTAPE